MDADRQTFRDIGLLRGRRQKLHGPTPLSSAPQKSDINSCFKLKTSQALSLNNPAWICLTNTAELSWISQRCLKNLMIAEKLKYGF